MKPPNRVEQAILELWPLGQWRDSKVVVAASGGADSTTLLEALYQIRPEPNQLIVAHFNHALRGDESDADQAFVEAHANRLGVPFETKRASDAEIASPSENSLRKIRHQFLLDVATRYGARWIAMAHHAGDQVETFLHHLLRGSGPSGLSGIQPFRSIDTLIDIARPMLRVPRSDILAYLSERHLTFRIDRSNASSDYTRNRIRNELLPMLREFAGSETLDERLMQACELIAEEHTVLKQLADRWLATIGQAPEDFGCASAPQHFSVPLPMCRNEPWPVIREAFVLVWHQRNWPLREMNHRQWCKVRKLVEIASQTTHPKRLDLPGSIVIKCRKGMLRIEKLEAIRE